METNVLYYGDNLEVLRRHVKDESVDLVYLDPPFKSDVDYNVLFEEKDGSRSTAQIQAFTDTWTWDQTAAASYAEVVERGGRVADAMRAMRTFLGPNDMLAYLSMMAPRLIELQRVLKPTGSLYLHCDPTASHYLKLLLDAIFGPQNFRNEVIWWYRKWTRPEHHFLRNHQVLLFYAKGPHQQFNILRVPLSPSTIKRFGGKVQDFADEARTRKITLERESEGGFRPDVWDINLIPAQSIERLGYPTQKPLALLRLVLQASSNAGDVVLDPFCGCGTTLHAAQELGRRWVGIDITHLAVGLIKHRLVHAFTPKVLETFRVVGEPTDISGARQLAAADAFQFQAWALGLVGARVADSAKKGADRGVDGRLFFHDEGPSGRTKEVVLSVKAGHTGPTHVRDLVGVVEREEAEIGCLISMVEPTGPMRREAASAGFYTSVGWGGRQYARLQLLSIDGLLSGRQRLEYPAGNVTFKRAPRAVAPSPEHPSLFDGGVGEEPPAEYEGSDE